MATRLYPTDAPPSAALANAGTWGNTASALARALSKHHGGASAATSVSQAAGYYQHYRLVSGPLAAAATISGTLTWVLLMHNSNGQGQLRLHAWVSQGDAATPRGTLLNGWVQGGYLVGATHAGQTDGAVAVSSVSAQAGDRVVVEVGMQDRFGSGTCGIRRAGDAASDAANGTTDTARPGWFEFSANFVPVEYVPVRAWILE